MLKRDRLSLLSLKPDLQNPDFGIFRFGVTITELCDYYLMHRDYTVAKILKNGANYKCIEIIRPERMPVGTRNLNVDSTLFSRRFSEWLRLRCIPAVRVGTSGTRAKIETDFDVLAIENYGLSLTDCYWFKPIDQRMSWKKINFHKNGWKSNAGEVMFRGDDKSHITSFISPDVTTNGTHNKMWIRRNDGRISLIKDSLPENTAEGRRDEAVHEVIASCIARYLGINAVEYKLYHDNNLPGTYSICDLFIPDDRTEYVSLWQYKMENRLLVRPYERDFLNEMACSNGVKMKYDVNNMMLFDYIVSNSGGGNIGIIRDAETLHTICYAPLFGFRSALSYDHNHNVACEYQPKFFSWSKRDHCAELAHEYSLKPVSIDSKQLICLYLDKSEEYGICAAEQNAVSNMMKKNLDELERARVIIRRRT